MHLQPKHSGSPLRLTPSLGQRTALVVTEDRFVRNILQRILARDDVALAVARSLHEATAMLRSRDLSLIILDMGPCEAGRLMRLRKLKALVHNIPIIALGHRGNVDAAVMAMKFGAHDYLTKPIRARPLQTAVKRTFAQEGPRASVSLARQNRGSHVRNALHYLHLHYAEHVTVRLLAHALGLSESHLAHLFRAETGMSVQAHLRKIRTDAALRHLTTGGEPLAEIARRVGFYDGSHLTRTFVRLTGRLPSTHRRSIRWS